ncbi:Ig-like domain-containing protein [Microbulbifer sp. Q7]|uniref:Ig-like domain-containing protein n=1 Tax=Microbulbifer sp. Q7 TaxID=1785091 RepID=UPI00187C7A0E|nr:Ig-like domain-containing protein [Microbulbifer sp. Q7]
MIKQQKFCAVLLASIALPLFLSGCGGGGGGNDTPAPPSAISLSISLDEDTTIDGQVAGTAQAGGALSFELQQAADNGQVTLNGAAFTYTPNPDFAGQDSFRFTALEDGRRSTPATVTITVNPINDAPIATGGNFSTDEDIALTAMLPIEDVDGDQLTYSVTVEPANGELQISATGEFSYQPAKDFFGADEFRLTASDDEFETDEVTITLNITAVNDAPEVPEQISASLVAGATQGFDLQIVDVDSTDLTTTVIEQPEVASLASIDNELGNINLSATYGTWGVDQLSFITNDGELDSNTSVMTIDIAVGQTTTEESVVTLSSAGSTTVDLLADGPEGLVAMTGLSHGELGSTGSGLHQQFIAFADTAGEPAAAGYIQAANGIPIPLALGVNDSTAFTIAMDGSNQLHFGALSAAGAFTTNSALPSFEGDNHIQVTARYVPGSGFLLFSNDGVIRYYDQQGNTRWSKPVTHNLGFEIGAWHSHDIKVEGNTAHLVGMLMSCGDDGCGSMTSSGSFSLKLNLITGDITELYQPKTSSMAGYHLQITSDGRVLMAHRHQLTLFAADGTTEWEQSVNSANLSRIGLTESEDIMWWSHDTNNDFSTMTRLSIDSELQAQSTYSHGISYPWAEDIIVDKYGNTFIKLTDRYNDPDYNGDHVVLHYDYSTGAQWVQRSNGQYQPQSNIPAVMVLKDERQLFSGFYDYYGVSPGDAYLQKLTIDRNIP